MPMLLPPYANKQASKQTSKHAGKYLGGIQSEPCPVWGLLMY